MLRTTRIVTITVFACALLAAGCSQRDLGRYCFVGAEAGDNTNTMALTILNTEAPECGERLCLKQGGYKCADGAETCLTEPTNQEKIASMCTSECEENADCKGSDENVNGCSNYVCQKPSSVTQFEQCYCICLDYIRDSEGRPVTKEAYNLSDQACQAN